MTSLATTHSEHSRIAPGEIAIGVIIGRASEFFDFFVYGIAFVPGYASLGQLSIILLSVFRVGQGIALGGSWDGLPSLLALNAPASRRGWYAMLGQIGAPVGFTIASGLFAYLYSSLDQADF